MKTLLLMGAVLVTGAMAYTPYTWDNPPKGLFKNDEELQKAKAEAMKLRAALGIIDPPEEKVEVKKEEEEVFDPNPDEFSHPDPIGDLTRKALNYPGWVNLDVQYLLRSGDKTPNACAERVKKLYEALFPGALSSGPVSFKIVAGGARPNGGYGYMTGVTRPVTLNADRDNYHSMDRAKVRGVVEIYESTPHTIHHELAHAYDVSIKNSSEGHHFYEEGMAVMVEMLLEPEMAASYSSNIQKWITTHKDAATLKKTILYKGIGGSPTWREYPLAGFFMMQVLNYAGPEALKYLISTNDSVPLIERNLKSYLWAKGITPEEFWLKVYNNAKKWKP